MVFDLPAQQGLYRPDFEHDACGVAFVARLSGVPTHDIVEQGLEALRNLDHRGATGADAAAGFADERERFREQIVERLPGGDARLVGSRLLTQAVVGERARRRLEFADTRDERTQPLEIAVVLGAEDLGE